MQVRTQHFPLGFGEHPFLNAGVGVHSETIVAFLARNGVTVATG